jgi:hypothetical protein
MTLRLSDRLHAARRRRFVGRETERELFVSALQASELPFCLLYLFGPGGVGKTTLLKEFGYLTESAGMPAIYLDGRNIEPAPESFVAALRITMGLAADVSPLEAMGGAAGRRVILIDTYETLTPLDGWLRESFLPQLPDETLIVLAGRLPISSAWRSDPGWQSMIRPISLRNLSSDECRDYLTRRSIPSEQQPDVLRFTHGHPLALSLVADVFAQRGDFRFRPEAAPDIVKALLEELVQKVPGPAHRTALEACALVRLTTEDLLETMVGTPNAHELFEWLRGLSFIDAGPLGLFPHDLAREALVTDLRWRNPTWYAELHKRARTYYTKALARSGEQEQQRVLFDYVFLHRDNAVMRSFFEWQEVGNVHPARMEPGDVPLLTAMVEQHEGAESAQLAAHWLERQPEGVIVFRDMDHQPYAFMHMVALQRASEAELQADPGALAAWRYLQRHAPLRPGESATCFRFWMARDTYQDVSPAQSLVFINCVRHYLTTPGLVYTFLPCADPDFWAPLFAYADLAAIPEAGFEVGGRHYGVYGHNWRAVPPMPWLALLAEREIAMTPQTSAPPPVNVPLVVLSQDAFATAVRDALHDYTRPDALHRNPLLQSRLISERVDLNAVTAERVAALLGLLKKAAESLESSPQEAKLYRAVYHTYLHPVPTQEQAAELLDLPFSTFRRHLKHGVTRIAEILWQWELEGLSVDAGS